MIDAVLAHYVRALAERPELASADWYRDQAQYLRGLAAGLSVDPERLVWAAAIVSPRVNWRIVLDRLPDLVRGRPTPFLGRASQKARLVLASPVVRSAGAPLCPWVDPRTSPKVHRFARNLLGDYGPVTVDVWTARSVGLDPARLTHARYLRAEAAYQGAAEILGLPPALVQSRVWVHLRGAA